MQLHTIVTGELVPNTPQIAMLSILPGYYKNIDLIVAVLMQL